MQAVEYALHIHIDHGVPLFDFAAHERVKISEARIVDEYVNLTKRIDKLLNRRLHIFIARYIACEHKASLAQLCSQRIQLIGAARHQPQPISFRMQHARRGRAYTRARPGDENVFHGAKMGKLKGWMA
jgi:hypothetical protein